MVPSHPEWSIQAFLLAGRSYWEKPPPVAHDAEALKASSLKDASSKKSPKDLSKILFKLLSWLGGRLKNGSFPFPATPAPLLASPDSLQRGEGWGPAVFSTPHPALQDERRRST